MIVASAVMCSLATSQIIVDSVNIFRAFIPLDRIQRQEFLSDATQPIFAAKHAIYFTMVIVGDIIVVSMLSQLNNSRKKLTRLYFIIQDLSLLRSVGSELLGCVLPHALFFGKRKYVCLLGV